MITLTSTLADILTEFVILDADHDPANSEVTQDLTTIKVFWPDTSRVRLDVSVMSTDGGGVAMIVPPYVEVPGGDNPNNPPAPPEPPPVGP